MSEARLPAYVVDASVGLKWLLRLDDEPHHEIADQVLKDYTAGAVWLNTVPHTPWEVGHALVGAIRQHRLTQEQAIAAMQLFDFWRIPVVTDHANLRPRALEMAVEFGCGFYDATYLAAADLLGNRFVHADAKLRRILAGRFPLELWIEEYEPMGHR